MTGLRESDWLAGFADGEGCFYIAPVARGFTPGFSIMLRADDAVVLDDLRAEFGGAVHVSHPPTAHSPRASWVVGRKRDLVGLVNYFFEHPLRAKKQRDFAIWRRAVEAYCREGKAAPELPALCDALREVRQFEVTDVELASAEYPQLELGADE